MRQLYSSVARPVINFITKVWVVALMMFKFAIIGNVKCVRVRSVDEQPS